MIKTIFILFVSIVICLNSGTSLFAQKNRKLKMTGKVVAYDKLSPLISITSAPNVQTFIVRVNKVIRGKEPENFIIVVHKSFGVENELLKQVLKNGSNEVRLKLDREESCDSKLEKLQIEWVDKNTPRPDSRMPCYLLDDKDIIFVK